MERTMGRPKIKFSHKYFKLGKLKSGGLARLVLVETIKLQDQTTHLLDYDTTYPDGWIIARYPLPRKGEYLLLGFIADGVFFTTLRRAFPRTKVEWYSKQVGETFELVIEDPPEHCPGCSFKCIASDCDCTCHDKIREYHKRRFGKDSDLL